MPDPVTGTSDLPTDRPTGPSSSGDRSDQRTAPARLRVDYYRNDEAFRTPVLAAMRFGVEPPGTGQLETGQSETGAPLTIGVHLDTLHDSPQIEAWAANGPVRTGSAGEVRYAHDDHHLFAVVEIEEQAHDGVHGSSVAAYEQLVRFQAGCGFPQVLRIWNYMDAITDGSGDLERYRQFCAGRVQGLGAAAPQRFPAATAIGHQRATGRLQVFWLAAKAPGTPLENPRQVSAWRYPRVYAPVSPTFSRATTAPDGAVLISGTASIVGHTSMHFGDHTAQLEEILRNLQALTAQTAPGNGSDAHTSELLKVYVRHPEHTAAIAQRLRETHPHSPTMFLAADICRRELLVEIEAVRWREAVGG